jgi:hypothetical protein
MVHRDEAFLRIGTTEKKIHAWNFLLEVGEVIIEKWCLPIGCSDSVSPAMLSPTEN